MEHKGTRGKNITGADAMGYASSKRNQSNCGNAYGISADEWSILLHNIYIKTK